MNVNQFKYHQNDYLLAGISPGGRLSGEYGSMLHTWQPQVVRQVDHAWGPRVSPRGPTTAPT